MMNLAMNFDTDECSVTAMFDKGNRNDTMEAIDHIIPFLKGDEDLINEFFEITRFNIYDITLQYTKINLTRLLEQLVYDFKPMLKLSLIHI